MSYKLQDMPDKPTEEKRSITYAAGSIIVTLYAISLALGGPLVPFIIADTLSLAVN